MVKRIKRDKHIRLADGRSATLSTVQLSSGVYETMLLSNNGDRDEITSRQSTSLDEALCFFGETKERYYVPELTGKYKKLVEDLRAALAYGLERMGTDDGGTSNFDAPTISLPKWDKKLVEAAAKTAGLRCWEWELWGDKAYVLTFPGVGQGYTRTKASETITQYLKEQGYDAGMYYQMD